MTAYAEILVQILTATILGALLALPSRRQPAGMRAHALVIVGALLFCHVARVLSPHGADTMRVLQGVATGVGFIGGAAVLKLASSVRGVNTSASIWIAAALGCLIAFTPLVDAIAIGITVATINVGLHLFEERWLRRRQYVVAAAAVRTPAAGAGAG